MATPTLDPTAVHRPRNVDWKRAAALLYGDWGTSKAYVIGLAFIAAGFASGPIILAVCAADRGGRLQLHHRLRPFSRWGRRLLGRAATEPIPRLDGGALAHRQFYCHRGVERLGGGELSGRSKQICACRHDGTHPGRRRRQLFRAKTQRQRFHLAGHSSR